MSYCAKTYEYQSGGSMLLKHTILYSSILFLLALLPRLYSNNIGEPQGDEVLWNERSVIFREAMSSGEYATATSHLGHPAIPAVVAMATAQHINTRLPSSWRLDDLSAARVGNAIISAFIAPLVLVLLSPLVGLSCAAIAAILIACDPQHVAVSRMAHVDSSFSLFVVASSICYFRGTQAKRAPFVLGAGFLWGLALACKPTALCLPGAFFAWNVTQRFVLRRRDIQLVSWNDVWAVCLGLGTFAGVFTKFWHHHGPFLTQFHIESPAAEWVYRIGTLLGSYSAAVSALAVLLCLISFRALPSWAARLLTTGALGTVALALFPGIFENYIRYFIRVPWLADYVSKDVGTGHPWIPGGYIGVLLFQLPSITVVLLVAGVIFILASLASKRLTHLTKEDEARIFLLIVISVWIATLSVSSRSYVRYIVPVLPLIYVVVATGLLSLVTVLFSPHRANRVGIAAATALCVVTVITTHPYYLNYFNIFFGGVARAEAAQYPLFYEGHEHALRFIDKLTAQNAAPHKVAVLGEYDVIKKTYERLYPAHPDRIEFVYAQWAQSADYIVVTEPLLPVSASRFGQTLQGTEQLYVHSREGVQFAGVYRGTDISPSDVLEFPLYGLKRDTGGTSLEDTSLGFTDRQVLYAMPERHRPGMLFRGGFLKIGSGNFSLGLSVAALPTRSSSDDVDQPVLTVRLGANCSRTIMRSELSSELSSIPFTCHLSEPKRLEVSGEWMGTIPLVIGTLEFLGEEDSV